LLQLAGTAGAVPGGSIAGTKMCATSTDPTPAAMAAAKGFISVPSKRAMV
jgi:hypothetical protein